MIDFLLPRFGRNPTPQTYRSITAPCLDDIGPRIFLILASLQTCIELPPAHIALLSLRLRNRLLHLLKSNQVTTMDTDNSNLTSVPHNVRPRHNSLPSNSVPFPSTPSAHNIRQISGESEGHTVAQSSQPKPREYPATYSYSSDHGQFSRDSFNVSSHRMSRAYSSYSHRHQSMNQQLSPVAEELYDHPLHGQSRLSRSGVASQHTRNSTIRVDPDNSSRSFSTYDGRNDPLANDLTVAMMLMMPSPNVDRKRMALKNEKAAKIKKKRASRIGGGTHRVASAAGRAVSALRRVLHGGH